MSGSPGSSARCLHSGFFLERGSTMSCCSSATSTSVDVNVEPATQPGASATTRYDVGGMTCGRCVASVSREVEALAGVTGVQVDLAAARLTVEGNRPIDATAVAAAVEKAGYRLTLASASVAAERRAPEGDAS